MDEDFKEKAKRMAAEHADDLKEKFAHLASAEEIEKLKATAGELAEEAAAFVRKHPLPSVAGALAVGFLLGAFLRRRE